MFFKICCKGTTFFLYMQDFGRKLSKIHAKTSFPTSDAVLFTIHYSLFIIHYSLFTPHFRFGLLSQGLDEGIDLLFGHMLHHYHVG